MKLKDFENRNEEVIYSFRLINSSKVISICKDKVNRYLVFRFDTDKRIEFEYPEKLDSTSWKAFELYELKPSGERLMQVLVIILSPFTMLE
ncbi:hypothetical protein ACFS7Z_21615 [Pontibacter toksunensis]|uniref:Uncharacterized protein n=1 Tax=Pontibacter toksunensis TaxID=1332631 RepID=A0ABW6BZ54_9BACT